MKRYEKLSEMKEAKVSKEIIEFLSKDILPNEIDQEDFIASLGGYVFIVEIQEDLLRIPTMVESKLPPNKQHPDCCGWASVVETVASFDQLVWIGNYLFVFTATNNAGGNSYFIPKAIAETCSNLMKSKRLFDANN
jgi:hypothetical protein